MELGAYFKAIFALSFVLFLVWIVSIFLKKFLLEKGFAVKNPVEKSLSIEESLFIDPRRRVVLIRRGDTGHLVLLNGNNDLLIESNIELKKDKK